MPFAEIRELMSEKGMEDGNYRRSEKRDAVSSFEFATLYHSRRRI
jgi:hypothetical protein